ncbi:MAG: YrdB family protein [Micrococcus sp.]|nr:YrdB family protein [Micrococcus sp.]
MNTGAATQAILMFLLELGLFGAAGFWALSVFGGPWAAVLAVIVVAAAWGLVLSPKAPVRPPWPWHAVLGHVLFLLGAVVLFVGGWPVLGAAYLTLILVSAALTVRFRDRLALDSARARQERREDTESSSVRPARPTGRRAAGRD